MKLFRHGFFHCAYVALLSVSGACMSSNDGQGLPGQVEATGEAHDLRASKHHKKRKHKKHYDKCEPSTCESLELRVDSHKHPEATEELDRSIRVEIPQKLPAQYWGSEVQAELTFQLDDESVVCSYKAKSRKSRALTLDSCDHGAKAFDVITIDSATLTLECSEILFAKVHVKLHELEPCDELACDPAEIDDGDPCTIDACAPDGGVTHEPAAAGTSCGAAADVCTGSPTCNAQGECVSGTPRSCDDGNACNGSEQCDPQAGCVPGSALVCDDGDACNGVEGCDAADGCSSGTPPDVDDDNVCTIDACDPDTGVSHQPAPEGTECGPESGCDAAGNCVEFR